MNTEEGAEAVRRAEAAFHASLRQQPPTSGAIPQALYEKARDSQDQLTQQERHLLLSRGDLVGKALASPDSLKTNEIHELLFWPPPDIARANIQRATGGTLSTPSELYAKAKDAMDRGQFETMLSHDEATLLSHSFYAVDDPAFSPGGILAGLGLPGRGQVFQLLANRLGLDYAISKAAAVRVVRSPQMAPTVPGPGPGSATAPVGVTATPAPIPQGQRDPLEIINAITSLREQFQLGNIPEEEFRARYKEYFAALRSLNPAPVPMAPASFPSQIQWPGPSLPPSSNDLFGSGPWPDTHARRGAFDLFKDETDLYGFDVQFRWQSLPEAHKEAYRVRAEASRRAAWAEFEVALATPPPTRLEDHMWSQSGAGRSLLPSHTLTLVVTGFELFRNERAVGLEYQVVVAMWEALTKEQRKAYAHRAWSMQREALVALPSDYMDKLQRKRGADGQ
ncbi:hypothetical protein C8A00DRAFT_38391 [Chaetomidium leptoderma]|uniref:Uncharacterized protein n=1 Tax=Chaetomidium leptoderma TaxID=669021 RepID=A0AAN6VF57_9PEZI|nr:hypothetical protein C8A00DRAFT_38391 [Chaetomidium leptoderma]